MKGSHVHLDIGVAHDVPSPIQHATAATGRERYRRRKRRCTGLHDVESGYTPVSFEDPSEPGRHRCGIGRGERVQP